MWIENEKKEELVALSHISSVGVDTCDGYWRIRVIDSSGRYICIAENLTRTLVMTALKKIRERIGDDRIVDMSAILLGASLVEKETLGGE
jgi:hypothetical protein